MELRFLSTLSLRRATGQAASRLAPKLYFYPRSPCGERPFEKFEGIIITKISIHALLAESDSLSGSTKPKARRISIHALLAESDKYINRRTNHIKRFLSTLSLRRATDVNNPVFAVTSISIHALLAESDRLWDCLDGFARLFLSTLSLRRATTYLSILF